jgi:hypothetical protein
VFQQPSTPDQTLNARSRAEAGRESRFLTWHDRNAFVPDPLPHLPTETLHPLVSCHHLPPRLTTLEIESQKFYIEFLVPGLIALIWQLLRRGASLGDKLLDWWVW